MSFAFPFLLWLLLLIPLMIAFTVWGWRRKQRLIGEFVQSRLLAHLTVGVAKSRQKMRLTLPIAALALLILALSRPQWGASLQEVRSTGLDVVIAIDTSRSMLARDILPDRIGRTKLAVQDLVKLSQNDRFGLVVFAGTAFLQCPLTLDENAFLQSLAAIDTKVIPEGGSAISEAIKTARTAFADTSDNVKVIVLFSDGEDHEEGVVETVREIVSKDVRIFTVGAGTTQGELIQVQEENGRTGYLKDESGNVVKSRLNEALLQEVAKEGKGFYLPLAAKDSMKILVERGLQPLPRSELTTRRMMQFIERFQWPLGLAILVLLVESFFPDRKRMPNPVSAATAAAKVATWILLFSLASSAMGSPNQGFKAYEKGDYEKALKEYLKSAQKKPKDSRLPFNAGASAYKSKDWDTATSLFEQSLSAEDLSLQENGYYNLGNTFYQKGETTQEPEQKKKLWEKSVQQYEKALQLNQTNQVAKQNQELVKQKLEELKKQQQQQQQQDKKDKKDEKDSKDQKDQQQQDGKDEKDQNAPQDSERDNEDQQPSGSKPNEEQSQSEDKEGGESKKPEKDSEQGEEKGTTPQGRPTKMTPEQAMKLLESMKDDEKALMLPPPKDRPAGARSRKNW